METSAITTISASAVPSGPDRIKTVAREFEAIFSSMMLRAMRQTVGDNELLPASMGEKIYTGMLDDEYAKLMSSGSTLGLAGLIEKEIRSQDHDVENPEALPLWMLDNKILPQGSGSGVGSSGGIAQRAEGAARWDDVIQSVASRYDVDPSLVTAVIAQESAGNHVAVSRAGAKGLMQLMDGTAREMGVQSSFNPQQNIEGGVRYLRRLIDKYDGDVNRALAAYNAGPGAVDKYNGIPPYRETQDYVRSVTAIRNYLVRNQDQAAAEEE